MTQKSNLQNGANSNGLSVKGSQTDDFPPDLLPSPQNTVDIQANQLSPKTGTQTLPTQKQRTPWWNLTSLRIKATVLAVSFSTVPVVLIAIASYYTASKGIREQIIQSELIKGQDLEDKLEQFIRQRYKDIIQLADYEAFTDPEVQEFYTPEKKNQVLNLYNDNSQLYENIATFDLKGDLLYTSKNNAITKASGLDWFEAGLTADDPVIVDPRPAVTDKKFSTFVAVPIKDRETGKTTSILRTRVPMSVISEVFGVDIDTKQGEAFYLTDSQGAITVSSDPETVQQNIEEIFPNLAAQIQQAGEEGLTKIATENGEKQIFTYLPNQNISEAYGLNWGLLLTRPTSVAFAPQRQLLSTLLLGTVIFAVLVAVIAATITRQATLPILAAADAVEKIGQGGLDTRVDIKGEDEIAQLGSNINLMADRIQTLLVENEEAVKQQAAAQTQAESAEKERQRSEALQYELTQLLNEMEEASKGNLTVRADLTAGEVGIIADVFNTIVESLRKIVVQVKQTTTQVNTSISENQGAIRQLADEALAQVEEIANTLNSVEQMSNSIQEVAKNASQAAEVARSASTTAQESGVVMDRTVASILNMRSTVAETAKKVKQLGESSQEISQVISLINEIALKTNLLAVNAGIEAAHAGEQGKGFAVVAEQVGELAEQSAAATKEIEQIVKNIQTGTKEVVEAMELGTTQVVEGTNLVQETKLSLERILEVSREIDQFLQSISQATVSQAETSQLLTNLMKQIAQSSQGTSMSSRQVDSALRATVEVAQKLQVAVGQFKVGEEA
ncbi:methyl-accepting chemotaxis protein [Lyngbya aestuarii]|uniref:methyl-accepting chemotaxis protein n=1 Tax=Lyngbya aestuarii TaxID=118322 RepID=UPI00403E0B89